jgi:hypothetical protein
MNRSTNRESERKQIMAIQDLKLRRGQCGTQAQKILTTPGCTAEQRAEASRLLDEADALTEQITLLERAEHWREIPSTPRPAPGAITSTTTSARPGSA